MSPEYNFTLRADVEGIDQAIKLQEAVSMIKGVVSIEFVAPGSVSDFDPAKCNLDLSFGAVVQKWRESTGMTLSEFAKLAKLTKGYVSEVERDRIKNPGSKSRKKFSVALGYTRNLFSRSTITLK